LEGISAVALGDGWSAILHGHHLPFRRTKMILGKQGSTSSQSRTQKDAYKPENDRYLNANFSVEGRILYAEGTIRLQTTNPNHLPHIEKFDKDGIEKVAAFIERICVATYNAPQTGDYAGSHFLNIKMVSKSGHHTEIGHIRFDEDKASHEAFISRLLAEEPADRDAMATDILHEANWGYQSGVKVVHEYDDY